MERLLVRLVLMLGLEIIMPVRLVMLELLGIGLGFMLLRLRVVLRKLVLLGIRLVTLVLRTLVTLVRLGMLGIIPVRILF